MSPKRLMARWRSICPCLYVLPALIGGQAAGYYLSSSVSSGIAYLSCALSILLLAGIRIRPGLELCGIFLAGLLSMRWSLPGTADHALSEDESYLVKVEATPRRKSPGGIELSLELLGRVSREGKSLNQFGTKRMILCRAVELPWRNIEGASQGDVLIVRASFHRLGPDTSPLEYSSMLYRRGYEASCKIKYASPVLHVSPSALSDIREGLYARIRNTLGDRESSGLFLSLALGARDQLGRRTEEAFKRTGLAHLLVFSGYQVMLVYYSVVWIFSLLFRLSLRLLAPMWRKLSRLAPVSALFNAPALLSAVTLVALAGLEGSSLRAALATVLVTLVNLLERGAGMLNSIAVSFIIILLVWPGAFLEPGIQLTYGALTGIWLGNIRQSERTPISGFIHTGICVWIVTAIISTFWFDIFSPGAVLLNLIFAAPVSVIACNLGYVSILLLYAGIDSQGWCLQFCATLLWNFRDLVVSLARLPGICFELQGQSKWAVIMALLVLAVRIVNRPGKSRPV